MNTNLKHANELYQRFLGEQKSNPLNIETVDNQRINYTINALENLMSIMGFIINIYTGYRIGEISVNMFLCLVSNMVINILIAIMIDAVLDKFSEVELSKESPLLKLRLTVSSVLATFAFLPLWYFYLIPLYIDLT
jgi:ABC-type antimicrobial peptide transport system permease subunit